MRCFGSRSDGFYIDIGSGHPVYDNMSFAFYLKGWRGITVEPNPWLARLTPGGTAARPPHRGARRRRRGRGDLLSRERVPRALDHDRGARRGRADALRQVVAGDHRPGRPTLKELCEQHAPAVVRFLKVDVEGAEPDVLLNGDWQRYRPKVVVVEALAPYTLAPAWEAWEPFHGKARLSLCAVRQPQPLLPRGRSEPSSRPFFASAPASFDALPIPRRKPALTITRIPTIGWRRWWPALP